MMELLAQIFNFLAHVFKLVILVSLAQEFVVQVGIFTLAHTVTLLTCNILMYISSINTWASGDSPLAQLVKELDLCLFLCVIRQL